MQINALREFVYPPTERTISILFINVLAILYVPNKIRLPNIFEPAMLFTNYFPTIGTLATLFLTICTALTAIDLNFPIKDVRGARRILLAANLPKPFAAAFIGAYAKPINGIAINNASIIHETIHLGITKYPVGSMLLIGSFKQ